MTIKMLINELSMLKDKDKDIIFYHHESQLRFVPRDIMFKDMAGVESPYPYVLRIERE
jgi:hypothetical protein